VVQRIEHEIQLVHGYADLGDVRLHFVEAGQGPLVILLHGFPEFWYSWRHQIPALAVAGYQCDRAGYARIQSLRQTARCACLPWGSVNS
jgi:pimeloyl-ACP methyl ester carboxylesterase